MNGIRVAVSCLLLLAGSVHAADWELAPIVGLNGEYNDNPWLRDQNVKSVMGEVLDVALPLKASTARTEFLAVADGKMYRYNDPLFSHNDARLDLSLKDTGERHTLAVKANSTYDTTLTSELGTTGLTDVNKRHSHYDAALSPEFMLSETGLLDFDIRGQWNRYEDAALTGLVDYGYATALVAYQHRVSPATLIGVGVQGGQLSVPDNRALDTTDGLLRFSLTHNFSERLTVDGFAGPSVARLNATGDRNTGGQGAVNIKYSGSRTDFSLSVARLLLPTGYGALTKQSSVAVSMTHGLTDRLSSVTTLSYLDTLYLHFATTSSRYSVADWRVDELLRWQWTETAALSLMVSETEQAVGTPSTHANRFVANAGIIWAPHRLF